MSKFTTFANDCLDAFYDNTATGSLALGTNGAATYARPFKLRLTTTVSVAGTAGTEVSGGSYAAANINTMAAASAASKASSASVSFASMPACTWADVYITDAGGTPKLMNFRGGASLAKTVNAGDTVIVSSLTGTES